MKVYLYDCSVIAGNKTSFLMRTFFEDVFRGWENLIKRLRSQL